MRRTGWHTASLSSETKIIITCKQNKNNVYRNGIDNTIRKIQSIIWPQLTASCTSILPSHMFRFACQKSCLTLEAWAVYKIIRARRRMCLLAPSLIFVPVAINSQLPSQHVLASNGTCIVPDDGISLAKLIAYTNTHQSIYTTCTQRICSFGRVKFGEEGEGSWLSGVYSSDQIEKCSARRFVTRRTARAFGQDLRQRNF